MICINTELLFFLFIVCRTGWFGVSCSQPCDCFNADSCDSVTGKCMCKPGFTGDSCENGVFQICDLMFYSSYVHVVVT